MPGHSRRAMGALSAAYFVFGTGSLAVVGLIEPMSRHLRVSQSAIAQLVTVFALAFALLAPLVQVVASKLPRRSLIVGGLSIVAVGLLGTAWAPSLPLAMAFRVLTALGAAAVGPVASSLATSLVPASQQAKALATVFAGMTIATVVGVPLSAWLGHLISWQAVFVLLAVLACACAAAVRVWVVDTSGGSLVRLVDLLSVVRRPSSRWAFGATLMQMAAQFATYALIAVLLRERFGASPALVSVALMVFGVGGVLANALVGQIGDRVPVETLIRGSLVALATVFAALLLVAAHIGLAIVLVASWSLAATVFMVPQQKRLISLAPGQRGLLLAVNASALYLGMSLGAVVGAMTHGLMGVRWLPLISMLLVVAAMASHLLSGRAVRHEQQRAACETDGTGSRPAAVVRTRPPGP